ncbi:hypothetical protein HPB50_007233 [Hyalomma asiaticum]|uniref:Uncharacterized protein n=1 Tax=Hyalomma asiaticum TaxID=266040 RepID=A0ACB7RVT9_HYAAI|nr:hypothetical protein HPB50_007233 [Hyalomma asiaticum]
MWEARAVWRQRVHLTCLGGVSPRVLCDKQHTRGKIVGHFLASCRNRVVSLLLDLPKQAKRQGKSVGELLATLLSHNIPTPSTLMGWLRFNNWSQREGETPEQFVAVP